MRYHTIQKFGERKFGYFIQDRNLVDNNMQHIIKCMPTLHVFSYLIFGQVN